MKTIDITTEAVRTQVSAYGASLQSAQAGALTELVAASFADGLNANAHGMDTEMLASLVPQEVLSAMVALAAPFADNLAGGEHGVDLDIAISALIAMRTRLA
ncbi:hypothetical protein [Streptomyces sp. H39-C1]|uniref:hypothetical protein n=1 Tax=Streptomyces sp. H39-C1 TaxID=3004355 RepID=UPI0022B02451|nr:hypothetical protein [Streptomyces sp. H39-C1]MCZ4099820.1 hypothetical protein [Streptomyces sp. H39-C1]